MCREYQSLSSVSLHKIPVRLHYSGLIFYLCFYSPKHMAYSLWAFNFQTSHCAQEYNTNCHSILLLTTKRNLKQGYTNWPRYCNHFHKRPISCFGDFEGEDCLLRATPTIVFRQGLQLQRTSDSPDTGPWWLARSYLVTLSMHPLFFFLLSPPPPLVFCHPFFNKQR